MNEEKKKEIAAVKKYYQNLYYANKLMLTWNTLKQRKSKKSLQEFLIAYHNAT